MTSSCGVSSRCQTQKDEITKKGEDNHFKTARGHCQLEQHLASAHYKDIENEKQKTLQKHLLQHSSCTEAEEVQVDGQATVKPIFLKTEGGTIQVDFEKSLSLSILVNLQRCKSSLLYSRRM